MNLTKKETLQVLKKKKKNKTVNKGKISLSNFNIKKISSKFSKKKKQFDN